MTRQFMRSSISPQDSKLLSKTSEHPFHLVYFSPWPLLTSAAALVFLLGKVMYMHAWLSGGYVLALGFLYVLYCLACWWRDVVVEAAIKDGLQKHFYAICTIIIIISITIFGAVSAPNFTSGLSHMVGEPVLFLSDPETRNSISEDSSIRFIAVYYAFFVYNLLHYIAVNALKSGVCALLVLANHIGFPMDRAPILIELVTPTLLLKSKLMASSQTIIYYNYIFQAKTYIFQAKEIYYSPRFNLWLLLSIFLSIVQIFQIAPFFWIALWTTVFLFLVFEALITSVPSIRWAWLIKSLAYLDTWKFDIQFQLTINLHIYLYHSLKLKFLQPLHLII